jgi:hypothetical protein
MRGMTSDVTLVEPVPIEDDLCTALAVIEPVGIGVRLVFYLEQTVYESGEAANVVKRKIVLPLPALAQLLEETAAYLARQEPLRLVK